jgi:hypothetical protein
LHVKSTEKGQLIEKIHEKLLDTYFFSIIEDWKNIPTIIKVTAVSFIANSRLPMWDCSIRGKKAV